MSTIADASLRRLTEEQRAIAELAFAIGATYADRRFDDHDASMAQWEELAASGLTGLSLPEEYGGGGGMLELCIACERLAAGGYPAAKLIISTAMAGTMIARHGTQEQQERWLPGIASGRNRFCFAFTEPEAGSNANNLLTAATPTADGFSVTGAKTYISALESSETMIVVARDAESGGLTLLVLPTPCQNVTATPVHVDAPAFEHQWSVFFDGAVAPATDVLGEPGKGGRVLFDGLNPERLMGAAMCTGIARYALDKACAYVREREVWGVPIGAHQGVAHPLAEAKIELEAARLVLQRGALLYDAGLDAAEASNMAKFTASEVSLRALDRSMQAHGGNGLALEYGLADLWFVARLLRTAPISREMVLNHIAEHSLGLPRSY